MSIDLDVMKVENNLDRAYEVLADVMLHLLDVVRSLGLFGLSNGWQDEIDPGYLFQ
jgi:hypothetical protein